MSYIERFRDERVLEEMTADLLTAINKAVESVTKDQKVVAGKIEALEERVAEYVGKRQTLTQEVAELKKQNSDLLVAGEDASKVEKKLQEQTQTLAQCEQMLAQLQADHGNAQAEVKQLERELFVRLDQVVRGELLVRYRDRLNDLLYQASIIQTCWPYAVKAANLAFKATTGREYGGFQGLKVDPYRSRFALRQ